MPQLEKIKHYQDGVVSKKGVPMIQVYVHRYLGTNKYMISDSSGTATLVADKERHIEIIKAKVLCYITLH